MTIIRRYSAINDTQIGKQKLIKVFMLQRKDKFANKT